MSPGVKALVARERFTEAKARMEEALRDLAEEVPTSGDGSMLVLPEEVCGELDALFSPYEDGRKWLAAQGK